MIAARIAASPPTPKAIPGREPAHAPFVAEASSPYSTSPDSIVSPATTFM